MFENRHQATQHMWRQFAFDHLSGPLRVVSAQCHGLAADMIDMLPDGPELTAGLRKLREAKDCFVIARVDQLREEKEKE